MLSTRGVVSSCLQAYVGELQVTPTNRVGFKWALLAEFGCDDATRMTHQDLTDWTQSNGKKMSLILVQNKLHQRFKQHLTLNQMLLDGQARSCYFSKLWM